MFLLISKCVSVGFFLGLNVCLRLSLAGVYLEERGVVFVSPPPQKKTQGHFFEVSGCQQRKRTLSTPVTVLFSSQLYILVFIVLFLPFILPSSPFLAAFSWNINTHTQTHTDLQPCASPSMHCVTFNPNP